MSSGTYDIVVIGAGSFLSFILGLPFTLAISVHGCRRAHSLVLTSLGVIGLTTALSI
jgi:hypothetical protein